MSRRSRVPAFQFKDPSTYHHVSKPVKNDGFANAVRAENEALAAAAAITTNPATLNPPLGTPQQYASAPLPTLQGFHFSNPPVPPHMPAIHQPPPTASYSPANSIPAAPLEDRYPYQIGPHYNPASNSSGGGGGGGGPNLILGMHPIQALRICLGVTFCLILLLLTGVLLFALLSRDSHHHLDDTSVTSIAAVPAIIIAHGLTEDSRWKEFVFNFTTTNALYEEQRYPPVGGSISDFVDEFSFHDVITDYDVCCLHQELRLVCISRSAAFNHGNYLIDGEVDWDTGSNEVFLRLLVNSEYLLGVECFMTGRYFKP
jgi:hypothetical protein